MLPVVYTTLLRDEQVSDDDAVVAGRDEDAVAVADAAVTVGAAAVLGHSRGDAAFHAPRPE